MGKKAARKSEKLVTSKIKQKKNKSGNKKLELLEKRLDEQLAQLSERHSAVVRKLSEMEEKVSERLE